MDRRSGNKIYRSQLLHAQNTQHFINKQHMFTPGYVTGN